METETHMAIGSSAPVPAVLSIRQVKIPVTDLRRSVEWYTSLLGLKLLRKFVEDGELAGAVLSHPAGFVISVRLRSLVPGAPSFAGFDLFSLGVASRDELDLLLSRAIELGAAHGEIVDRGIDGLHLDIADPDGTLVRFLTPAAVDGAGFVGVSFDDSGVPTFYSNPLLKPS